jgi:hypothetical protein
VQGKEKWMELCEQAANEQDPQKLQAVIAQDLRPSRSQSIG